MTTTQSKRISISCPYCTRRLQARGNLLGKEVRCQNCSRRFVVKLPASVSRPRRGTTDPAPRDANAGTHPFHLDRPVFHYGPSDHVSWRMLERGLYCQGSTGSGKSSAIAKLAVLSSLRLGAGAIFCTVKRTDGDAYRELARLANREDDIVTLEPDNGVFNWLDWESKHAQGTFTENIVDQFYSLQRLSDGGTSDGQGDGYWRFALKQLIRNAITLLVLADEQVSLLNINRVINSMPNSPEQCHDPNWQSESYCCELLGYCTAKSMSESEQADLELVGTFCMRQMAELHPKTRGIIISSFTGIAEIFLFGKYRQMFAQGQSTLTPEQTWADQKNILIIDLPIDLYFEAGRLAQMLIKRCFQRAIQAREVRENAPVVLCVIDEVQYLLDPEADVLFTSNCRSKRVVNFWLSQSIDAIYSACGGGSKGEQSANAVLANLSNKILLQQSSNSAEWVSKLFGEAYCYLDFGGGSMGPSGLMGGGGHGGASKQLQPRVLPSDLYDLKTGGAEGIVSGYVWQGGTNFSNGQPVMKVEFSQNDHGGES